MCGRLVFFLGNAIQETIPILRQQMDWVGVVRKIAFFADVHYYIYANVGWMGGLEKDQKCADVIKGWSPYMAMEGVSFSSNGER